MKPAFGERSKKILKFGLLSALVQLAVHPALAASDSQPQGMRTQPEVRATEGAPDAIRFDRGGFQVWEYSPRRDRPAMEIRFSGQSSVTGTRILRGDSDLTRVQAERLSLQQTLELLGQPSAVAVTPEGLQWRYRGVGGETIVISFDTDGHALSVGTAR